MLKLFINQASNGLCEAKMLFLPRRSPFMKVFSFHYYFSKLAQYRVYMMISYIYIWHIYNDIYIYMSSYLLFHSYHCSFPSPLFLHYPVNRLFHYIIHYPPLLPPTPFSFIRPVSWSHFYTWVNGTHTHNSMNEGRHAVFVFANLASFLNPFISGSSHFPRSIRISSFLA